MAEGTIIKASSFTMKETYGISLPDIRDENGYIVEFKSAKPIEGISYKGYLFRTASSGMLVTNIAGRTLLAKILEAIESGADFKSKDYLEFSKAGIRLEKENATLAESYESMQAQLMSNKLASQEEASGEGLDGLDLGELNIGELAIGDAPVSETTAGATEQVDQVDQVPMEMQSTVNQMANEIDKEDFSAAARVDNLSEQRYHCKKVYRTRIPGKPERMTKFDLYDELSETTQAVKRDFIDTVMKNPRATGEMDAFLNGVKSSAIEGLYFQRYLDRKTGKVTWHLRVADNVEQVIAYGDDEQVSYTLQKCYYKKTKAGGQGPIVTYVLTNDTTGETLNVGRDQIASLCLDTTAVAAEQKFVNSRIKGLRPAYWFDERSGKHTWRFRVKKGIPILPIEELVEDKDTASTLEDGHELVCLRAYRVTPPGSSKGLIASYDIASGNNVMNLVTRDVRKLCKIPGAEGAKAYDAYKIKGLVLRYVSKEDAWRVRMAPVNKNNNYQPEIVDITPEQYEQRYGKDISKATKAANKMSAENDAAKEQRAEFIITERIGSFLPNGKKKTKAIAYRAKNENGEWETGKVMVKDFIEEVLGEPNRERLSDARRKICGATITINSSGKWQLLYRSTVPFTET